ncbi:hypothetical protein ROZALSC1DRAFT_25585 [Rozella allomycis CSF55]|uniref:ethanolamine kinase n=1 Tax=Rozella allomycis (strain CSF55) TaxID=988480 RepID=A0A4P9YDA3_ROZAC|nr:hypothetical protein ROZALSC1DRAFT_25585 [Rozella allomycis CSF55]
MLKSETDEITFKNRNNYKTDDVKRGFEDGHIDSKILIFRDIIPMDNFIEHSTMLIKKLYPQWRHLKTKEFTDGITNQRKLLIRLLNKRVLVRGFGNQTELLIDRNQELKLSSLEKLIEEANWLQQRLETIESPVVFCHNDLLAANIILQENRNKLSSNEY